MKLKNEEIAARLELIIQDLVGVRYLVNPFFRISKLTPEQIKSYRFIFMNYSRVLLMFLAFICIPINLIKITIQFSLSILFSYQYLLFKPQDITPKTLFVSHGIGANLTKKDSDQFFASMPNYLKDKNLSPAIIYTNHSKFGYYRRLKLIKSKSGGIHRFLVPKFLKPTETIKYTASIVRMYLKCLKIAMLKFFDDPVTSKILLNGAITFFDRPTYSNYLLFKRVADLCSENTGCKIFLTFEGHSYEQYIVDSLFEIFTKLRVVMYQHSPITPAHSGLKYFLQNNKRNISILTTGTYYLNYLRDISRIPNYILVGSNKFELKQNNNEIPKGTSILFTPEGTISATKDFIKLINYLSKKDPNHNYVLRLHPNLPRKLILFILLVKLKKQKNFIVSKNLLQTDLNSAAYIFYRSSAVGIQALNSNATLVFYSRQEFVNLNVISMNSDAFILVSSFEAALELVNSNILKRASKSKNKVLPNLFAELDYEKLDLIY